MQNDLVADLPTLSNRYEILELVRNDRTWVTLIARDHVLKKDVYLKTARESHSLNGADMAAFESQARLAARLSHPRIESILDFGEALYAWQLQILLSHYTRCIHCSIVSYLPA